MTGVSKSGKSNDVEEYNLNSSYALLVKVVLFETAAQCLRENMTILKLNEISNLVIFGGLLSIFWDNRFKWISEYEQNWTVSV